ncbi:MAG TPA: ABC transporter permease [Candidatus Binataceae bacterium]
MIPIRYNLRSLLERRTTSLMTALGVALVVMVLLILLGFVDGLSRTVRKAGAGGGWIVMSRGVTAEPNSYITHEQFEIVKSRSEIATVPSGEALISPEIITGFNADPDGPPAQASFTLLRGVYPIAQQVHSRMRVVEGRWPGRGKSEMIAGRKLAARHPDLRPGNKIRFGRRTWEIVGTFSDDDSARESEMWTDLDVLQQDVRYGNGLAALHVVLKPGFEDAFKQALSHDARLRVDATTEREFYADQSRFADQLRGLGLIVAAILAIGATFGGMNTMYTSVARRTREVGVLRSLGFSRANILLSFVAESVLLGVAGGAIGELLGVAVASASGLNGRLLNVDMFIFSFHLTPSAFVWGLVAAATIGALGGLLPAWRAARIGVMDALRAA